MRCDAVRCRARAVPRRAVLCSCRAPCCLGRYDALAELCLLLGDRDAYLSLWKRRAVHTETVCALSLEQFGAWHAAQAAYAECMNRWQAGEMALVNTPQADPLPSLPPELL